MPYEPIPLPQKRQLGWLMWELWKATLSGNPDAPIVETRRERMASPQPGDMVVDMSTLGMALNHPDPDSPWCLDRWEGQFVRYLRTEGPASDPRHVCETPDGSTFRWSNCELVTAPINGAVKIAPS